MTPFFKTTRHDYCINGVFVRLVNCPIKGDHRQLAPTAEAWRGYAMRRWGKDVVDLTVTWDEHGRVTHNVEFSLKLGQHTGCCRSRPARRWRDENASVQGLIGGAYTD